MKKSLEFLQALILSGKVSPDDFYNIRLTEGWIFLQGRFSANLVLGYKKYGFNFVISESGYVEATKILNIDIEPEDLSITIALT